MKNSIFKLMMATVILLGVGSTQAQMTIPAPVITTDNTSLVFTVGTAVNFTFTATGTVYDWAITGLPAGITQQTNAPATPSKGLATISGNPTSAGVYTVSVTVYSPNATNNGRQNSMQRTFYITILQKPATLVWNIVPSSITYGDADKQISAQSSADAVITYSTSNTSIATVTPTTGSSTSITKLHPVGAGTVTITATSASTGGYESEKLTTTININPATISVTGVKVKNKPYDGNSNAEIDLTGSTLVFNTKVNSGDDLTLDGVAANATFVNTSGVLQMNKGLWQTQVSGLVLSGTSAKNYTMPNQPKSLDARIEPVTVDILKLKANDKVYDGNKEVTSFDESQAVMYPDYEGAVHSKLWFNIGKGEFTDKNIGSQSVTYSGFTLTGTQAGNYTLNQPTQDAYNFPKITPKNIYIKNKSLLVKDKDFNGLLDATYTNTPIFEEGATKGAIAGDIVTLTKGTPTFSDRFVELDETTTPPTILNVNTNRENFELDGPDKDNYTLVQPDTLITAKINPMEVIITEMVAQSKVYDGTTKVKLTGTPRITGYRVDDVVTKAAITNYHPTVIYGDTAHLQTKNAGKDIGVVFNDFALQSGFAKNYKMVRQPDDIMVDIEPKPIFVDSVEIQEKPYDGLTSATIKNVFLTGFVDKETEAGYNFSSFFNATGKFTSADAGTGKEVLVTGINLAGSQGSANYRLTYGADTTYVAHNGVITKRPIKVINAVVKDKKYDATTKAQVDSLIFENLQRDEKFILDRDYTFTKEESVFEDKDVADGKLVNIIGIQLIADAPISKNYELENRQSSFVKKANITKRPIYIKRPIDPFTKEYDGNNIADVKLLELQFDSLALGEVLTKGTDYKFNDTGYYISKYVQRSDSISIQGIGLIKNSPYGKNYELDPTTYNAIKGKITPKPITVDGANVIVKRYDGKRNADVQYLTFDGLIEGDALHKGTDYKFAEPMFQNKNVEKDATGLVIDKNIEVNDIELLSTSMEAMNYSLQPNYFAIVKGKVEPKALTIDSAIIPTRVYDGTTDAFVAGLVFDGFIEIPGTTDKESFTLADYTLDQNGTFDTKNVGTRKGVGIKDIKLQPNGPVSKNYTLKENTYISNSGIIEKRPLEIISATIRDKLYDGEVNNAKVLSLNFNGFANATDSLAFSVANYALNPNGTYVAKKLGDAAYAGIDKHVEVQGIALANTALASNYTLIPYGGTTPTTTFVTKNATILPATLTPKYADIADRVYNGTTEAVVKTIDFEGFVGTDAFALTDYTWDSAEYTTSNAGVNKPVNIYDVKLKNTVMANNYQLEKSDFKTIGGKVTKKDIGVSGAKITPKSYDANTRATVEELYFEGLVGNDELTLDDYEFRKLGTFDSPKAKKNKDVDITGIALNNTALAKNYALTIDNNEDEDGKISTFRTNTGLITQRVLSVDKANVKPKVYDGKSSVIVNSITFKGFPNDTEALAFAKSDFSFSKDGDFVDVSSGSGKDVIVHEVELTDDDSNYMLESPDQIAKGSGNVLEPKVKINSTSFTASLKKDANSYIEGADYIVPCGAESVNVNVQGTDSVYYQGEKVNPFTLDVSHPGIAKHNYEVMSDFGRVEYVFTTETRIPFDVLVVIKYHNTLIANDNFATNGGYNFIAYQWTKNGEDIEGATEQIYTTPIGQILDSKAEYGLTVWTDTHEVLRVCPAKALTSQMITQPSSLTVSPSPAEPDEILFVGGVPSKTKIVNVYDAGTGALDSSTPISYSSEVQEVTVRSPQKKGVYVIKAGDAAVKFIVK